MRTRGSQALAPFSAPVSCRGHLPLKTAAAADPDCCLSKN